MTMFDQIKKLYKNTWKVKDCQLSTLSFDYQCFKIVKEPFHPTLIDDVEHINLIPDELLSFFRSNQQTICFPLGYDESLIWGYALKGLDQRNFRLIKDEKVTFPPLYGLHNFSSFKKGQVIMLVEGIRDAVFVHQYYPFCIATLGFKSGNDFLSLLFSLTDRIVIGYDSDEAGDNAYANLTKIFNKFGVKSYRIRPLGKDFGDYFRYDRSFDSVINVLDKMNVNVS